MQSRDTYKANFRNTPWPELIYANTVKRFIHHLPGKNEIILQGLENIPAAHPVLFVINKPDPKLITDFVYSIIKYNNIRYTSYWIPDHILHYPLWRKLFNWGNAIPAPTRAIFVEEDFIHKTGRKPSPHELKIILNILDGQNAPTEEFETGLQTFFKNNKDKLAIHNYRDYFDSRYAIIIKTFINSHRRATRDHNLNVLAILDRDIM
ncbi:MAG: hypothetical protein PF689_01625 [Deltaproteobacteria bacterium]|jgi:hypothetical protein|nr:hypothetical protein [Deltaproteobacteria bacterium]